MNLRWPESSIEHQSVHRRRSSSSSSASIYIHTCVYKRSRFPQTQDLWRKTASMDYRVGRVSLDAISRWSRSPGCCGYILWCVFSVSGGISLFFCFLHFERTQPTASTRQPCLMYLSTSNEAVFCLYAKNLFIPGCVQGAIIN